MTPREQAIFSRSSEIAETGGRNARRLQSEFAGVLAAALVRRLKVLLRFVLRTSSAPVARLGD